MPEVSQSATSSEVLLRGLDGVPVAHDIIWPRDLHIRKHMRVTADQLGDDRTGHSGDIEAVFVGCELGMEHNLEQNVALLVL